jgi:hypothetical protein
VGRSIEGAFDPAAFGAEAISAEHPGVVESRTAIYVEVENGASKAVAASAGFLRDGVLPSQSTITGRRRDMVLTLVLPATRRCLSSAAHSDLLGSL